jgi:regulator of protease activity HflC (stomatin/prohibitin superfamily)
MILNNIKTPIYVGLGLIVSTICLILLIGSWYTIDQRERGVILRNGKLIGVAEPGLGFKIPVIDKVTPISVESYLSRYDKLAVYSKDQQAAVVIVSVGWRAAESEVASIYTQFGSLVMMRDRSISPKVFDEVKNVFGQYNAVTAIQDRVRLNADIESAIRRSVKGPFVIDSVQIENIDFSDAYEKSVEDRMLAEVEVQKLKQNAEREKVNAEIIVTKAKANADAVREVAMAEAEAIKLKGEAEAHAIAYKSRALKDNYELVSLSAVEKWDGKLPQTMVPDATLPFLSLK